MKRTKQFSSVQKLKAFLLEYENIDSDFWTAGGGYENIERKLESFSEHDWRVFEKEIPNWTLNHIEFLTGGVMNIDYYKNTFSEEDIQFTQKRFEMMPILLKLGGDSEGIVSENIGDFFQIYFDEIDAGNPKIVKAITEIKKWNDSRVWVDLKTGKKVKSSYTEIIDAAYKKVNKPI